jgi:hypothetical protein
MQVVRCALQVAVYYDIEDEVEKALEVSYQSLKAEGHIQD